MSLSAVVTDASWAFDMYESVRHRLPVAPFPASSQHVATLADLADDHDVFLLDAFGVLNRGDQPIPGAPERIAALQAAGKHVLVVTNAASYSKRYAIERYARFGFSFAPEDVVSSRDAVLVGLAAEPERRWGMMATRRFGTEGLEHLNVTFLAEDRSAYDAAEGFVFFGAGEWTEERQALLEASLIANPRPLLVGNPDIVAPYEGGLSREPGHFAHRIADRTGVVPQFFGKPFSNIFDLALSRVGDVPRERIVMVGDTLQTDILGGRAAGVRTALVTDYGALVGADVGQAVRQSGIVPDFILPRP